MTIAAEVLHVMTTTKRYVTWPKAFGGHSTEIEIVQGSRETFVTLSGGGMSQGEWRICEVPVHVLRDILAMVDALPKVDSPQPPPTPSR